MYQCIVDSLLTFTLILCRTLGTMYLLMLRHRDQFCNEAGSIWRLIFVYVLMPWLSKYRSMRRPPSLGPDENSGALPSSLSLRAMSLFDPHAYGGRVGSVVPATSRSGRGLSHVPPVAARTTRSSTLSLLEDNDEDKDIDELREELRQLKIQLRMGELNTSGSVLEQMSKARKTKFDSNTPKPGWEGDHEDALLPQGIEEEDSFGSEPEEGPVRARTGDASVGASRPSAWRREMSQGLMPMSHPTATPRRPKESEGESEEFVEV